MQRIDAHENGVLFFDPAGENSLVQETEALRWAS